MKNAREYLHDKIDRAGEEQLTIMVLWADAVIK